MSLAYATIPFGKRDFWEHQIRDDIDYHQHMDYIHTNPVKHGLVEVVADWPYSTFYRQCALGVYLKEWGQGVVMNDGIFGE